MATIYPNGVDNNASLPQAVDLITPVKAEVVNNLRNALVAIEAELGIDPSREYATVRDRLDAIEGGGLSSVHVYNNDSLIVPNVSKLNFKGAVSVSAEAGHEAEINISGALQEQESFIATAGQTTFSLSQLPLDGSAVQMFINGFKQRYGYDYAISGSTAIYSSSDYTIQNGDIVEFWYVVEGVFGGAGTGDGYITIYDEMNLISSDINAIRFVGGQVQATDEGGHIARVTISSIYQNLYDTLFVGNTTSGLNIVISDGDFITGTIGKYLKLKSDGGIRVSSSGGSDIYIETEPEGAISAANTGNIRVASGDSNLQSGNAIITTGASNSWVSGNTAVSTGNGTLWSGNIVLQTGTANFDATIYGFAYSGNIQLLTGQVFGNQQSSGSVGILTGNSDTGLTGGISLTTGGSTSLRSGSIGISTGVAGNISGDVQLSTGTGIIASGNISISVGQGPLGGNLILSAGTGTVSQGGSTRIYGGSSNNTGGSVNIAGGAGSIQAGSVSVRGGLSGSGIGGSVNIVGEDGYLGSGNISIRTENMLPPGAGFTGGITVSTGNTNDGYIGDILISGGNSSNSLYDGGKIILQPGWNPDGYSDVVIRTDGYEVIINNGNITLLSDIFSDLSVIPGGLPGVGYYSVWIKDGYCVITDSGGNTWGVDRGALHWNASGEIVLLSEKTAPTGNDLIIIEDSVSGNSKKKVKISNLPGGTGTDGYAIHTNVAGEIFGLTEKITPEANDILVLEDSSNLNNKKKVKFSKFGGGATGETFISPTPLNASINNYNPTGFSTATVLRIDSVADGYSITGFDGYATVVKKEVINVGVNIITIAHQDSGSSEWNRIISVIGGLNLNPDDAITILYDPVSLRWRVI